MHFSVTTTDGDTGRAAPIYKKEDSAKADAARRNDKAVEMSIKTRYAVYENPTPGGPTDLPK